jgi:hypothetical protein
MCKARTHFHPAAHRGAAASLTDRAVFGCRTGDTGVSPTAVVCELNDPFLMWAVGPVGLGIKDAGQRILNHVHCLASPFCVIFMMSSFRHALILWPATFSS